jgi:hypothetical protein
MQRWMRAGIAAGAVLVCATGCTLPDFLHRRQPTAAAQPAPQAAGWDDFIVSAYPAYRLVASPWLADSPSRLLVLQLRLNASGPGALSVTPDDVQLVLANGEHGRIFDRVRANELLRRATLADADLSYLQRAGHPPGGLDEAAQLQLTDMIGRNLLTEGAFTADQGLQGFVVVDTGAPLSSLDGVAVEVTAYRLSNSAPARGAYRFASAPPSPEAQ